jgi:hypothetical protein
MPVILATQEAEIRRVAVQSQSGQIVHKTLSQKHPTQKGAGKLVQEALSSNTSTRKKKKKRYDKVWWWCKRKVCFTDTLRAVEGQQRSMKS